MSKKTKKVHKPVILREFGIFRIVRTFDSNGNKVYFVDQRAVDSLGESTWIPHGEVNYGVITDPVPQNSRCIMDLLESLKVQKSK